MKQYRINEIFYSLQGEGFNTGRAAVFVRFSGCNLRCPFCDTNFSTFQLLTAQEILSAVRSHLPFSVSSGSAAASPFSAGSGSAAAPPSPASHAIAAAPPFSAGSGSAAAPQKVPPRPLVVLTGGEPSLQADAPLIDTFHQHGFTVAMESNGTHLPPINIDWLTISPKAHTVVTHCNELKCIFDEQGWVEVPANITADHYFLQPCDVGDPVRNARITAACVNYIKQHPRWCLSLQTHKLINIP